MSMLVLLVLALGALAPATAQAAPSFFADQYPVTIHGSVAKGAEKINIEGGAVECKGSYHAEAGEASTTLSLTPTYSECVFSGLAGSATTTGCTYVLHVSGKTAEDEYRSRFDVACEAGKAIKLVFATCEAEIPAQSGLASVRLINDTEAAPQRDITFDPEVSGLAYNVLKDGFACPFNGIGSKTGGTFTASSGTTLTGQSPSNPEVKVGVELR
jgi:hypothetical protein